MAGALLLKADRCGIHFGGLRALSRVSLEVREGELLAMIGPNGAGKTTFFNLMTGVYEPMEGELFFKGRRLEGLSPFQINRIGIARTFQNIRLFSNLTVEENVQVGFHRRTHSSLLSAVWRGRGYLAEEIEIRRMASELLEIFSLTALAGEPAQNLSYGNQRRLEIVRALATGPQLLLLDEPAAGMNPTEKNQLIQLIRLVHEKYRLAILLIEHDMSVVMTLCPKIIVLDYGEIIATGTPGEIRKDPKVIEAYLGVKVSGDYAPRN